MLDGRLLSAARYVRQGAVFADVGTDHGYLPIFLLNEGRVERVIMTDINEGPLSSARRNLAEAGLLDRAELILTDGALELSGRGVTDLSVCGMGGELIARIIAECDFLRERGIRLILQPMTRHGALRRALYLMGYRPVAEHYSVADGKSYVTFVYEYSAPSLDIDPVTAELGDMSVAFGDIEDIRAYLLSRRTSLSRTLAGKRTAGRDISLEGALLNEIDLRLSELRTF
jgi:tRNA (adenine22-N1)-methyltransferase